MLRLTTIIALASALSAQGVDLHTVRVAPRGDVVVVYSKGFATCAHLLTPNRQITHAQNIFCTQANQVAGVFARTAFNANLVVGNPVQLCNGNNYGQCSAQVIVETGPTLSADRWTMSLQAGGTQNFTVDAGSAFAGRNYLLLGSATGTTGFTFGTQHIPLDFDGYFTFTLSSPNVFPLVNTFGPLNAAGQAKVAQEHQSVADTLYRTMGMPGP